MSPDVALTLARVAALVIAVASLAALLVIAILELKTAQLLDKQDAEQRDAQKSRLQHDIDEVWAARRMREDEAKRSNDR